MRHAKLPVIILVTGALFACADAPPTASPPGIDAGKGASTDIPVTSTIADDPGLQIRSDGLGAYQNSSTLASVIQPIGAWVLDSYNPRNATRQVYLDFDQPISGSGPNGGDPTALPSGLYKLRIISKCNLYGNTMQGLAPGATMTCPLHVRFDYGVGAYALQMNPLGGDPSGSYPETEPATITCVHPASGGGPCVGWRFTPSGSAGTSNVAKLLKYETVKGKTTAVDQGDFRVSFAITVTSP